MIISQTHLVLAEDAVLLGVVRDQKDTVREHEGVVRVGHEKAKRIDQEDVAKNQEDVAKNQEDVIRLNSSIHLSRLI